MIAETHTCNHKFDSDSGSVATANSGGNLDGSSFIYLLASASLGLLSRLAWPGMTKLSKFRRRKTLVRSKYSRRRKKEDRIDIFFDDRKTDMEVNFICRVLSREQEIY
jgi:hypothetical protein